jgi:uncharacterized protein (DUF934 family)
MTTLDLNGQLLELQTPRSLGVQGGVLPADLPSLDELDVLSVSIGKFTDGRAYSTAFHVRKVLGFSGDLRATGEVLVDQLRLLAAVGFTSFELRADQDIALAKKVLTERSQPAYQSQHHQPNIFEQRHANQ